MDVTFIAENQEANSLGRIYCLWLITEHLGWTSRTLALQGTKVWEPLADSSFAETIERVPQKSLERSVPPDTDLIIACKPLPGSLGAAIPVARRRCLPLLVDVDDPDLEMRLRTGRPLAGLLRSLRHPRRTLADLRLRRMARLLPSIVSNPWLQQRYGGAIVPHVRPELSAGDPPTGAHPRVVFVGTNHRHKGVDLLRRAVGRLAVPYGYTLTVTDVPPSDAHPWETWTGSTSLEDGLQLVRDADIVALPSRATRQAEGQLPAKLIDAMMLGRAIAVSDVQPMPWAVADTSIIFDSNSREAVEGALLALLEPAERESLGARARHRALTEFSVATVAPRFRDACADAVRSHRSS
jgi:hypothetical protein